MKKYTVTITESYTKHIEIEANSKEDAEDKVLDGEGVTVYEKVFDFDVEVSE